MKDFWDYVNQDKSTGDTSLNRMRLASFPTPLSKKKSSIISTLVIKRRPSFNM